jgi:hypothetical protein
LSVPLDRQRAIVAALVTVRVKPTGPTTVPGSRHPERALREGTGVLEPDAIPITEQPRGLAHLHSSTGQHHVGNQIAGRATAYPPPPPAPPPPPPAPALPGS